MYTPILTLVPGDDRVTRRVAEEVATILHAEGLDTAMHDLDTPPALDAYGAVVIGTPMTDGGWQEDVSAFLESNRASLVALPVAVFALAETPGEADDRLGLIGEISRYRWLHPIAADVFHTPASHDATQGRANLEIVRSWARLVARLLTPAAVRQEWPRDTRPSGEGAPPSPLPDRRELPSP